MMDRWRLTLISWWLFRIAPWPFPSEQSWYTRDVIVHHQISSVYQRRLTKLMWRWLRRRREGGCLHLSPTVPEVHTIFREGTWVFATSLPMAPEGSGASGVKGTWPLRFYKMMSQSSLSMMTPPRDEGSSGTTTPSGLLEIWGEVLAQTLQDLQQTKALPNIRSKCLVDSDSEIHWWFVMNIYNIYIILYI